MYRILFVKALPFPSVLVLTVCRQLLTECALDAP